jgi:cysteinyl-tRNA synthetase
VLWKQSSAGEPGWDSPWGRGRPGWHIECSAMSAAYLGDVFDIHGGGLDLIFPHHENEIAQSRCAHGTPTMANYWMHNGFLEVEGKKMSKSEGNFVTINELLSTEKFGGRMWPGEVLRLAMLKTHYRQPIDWTVRGLEESRQIINSWADAIQPHGIDPEEGVPTLPRAVVSALCDDLNISQAITEMHGMARAAKNGDEKAAELLAGAADFLGLQRSKWDAKLEKHIFDSAFDDKVEVLIADRTAARARKDFKESDRIRDELAAMGVVIKDSKEGTTWEIAR